MLCVVFPVGIAVGVVHRAERLAGGAGGVSVLALRQDVSALVIVSVRQPTQLSDKP